jgi:hypothetical protein
MAVELGRISVVAVKKTRGVGLTTGVAEAAAGALRVTSAWTV